MSKDSRAVLVTAALSVLSLVEAILHIVGIPEQQTDSFLVVLLQAGLLITAIFAYAGSPSANQLVSNRLTNGLGAGLLAIFARDLAELFLYSLGVLQFSLIRAVMLTSPYSPAWSSILLTYLDHCMYFVSVGMIYALIAGKSKWFYGLAWAFLANAYFWREFLTSAIMLYVTYGISLGVLLQWFSKNQVDHNQL